MPEKGIRSNATGCLVLIVPVAFLMVFVSSTWRFLLALGVVAIAWNLWNEFQWSKISREIDPVFQREILANQGSITPLDLSLKAHRSDRESKKYLERKAEEFGAQKRTFADGKAVYYFLTVKTLGTLFDESEPPPESDLAEAIDAPAISQAVPEAPTTPIAQEVPPETPSETAPPNSAEIESETATDLNMVSLPPLTGSFGQETAESPQSAGDPVPDPWQSEEASTSSTIANLKPLIQAELAKRLDVSASTVFKRREEPDFREWTMARDPDGIAWEYSTKTKDFRPVEQA